ncbi:hypothetical protein [Pectinatus frisingensis]|jgi:hypothetical protein
MEKDCVILSGFNKIITKIHSFKIFYSATQAVEYVVYLAAFFICQIG